MIGIEEAWMFESWSSLQLWTREGGCVSEDISHPVDAERPLAYGVLSRLQLLSDWLEQREKGEDLVSSIRGLLGCYCKCGSTSISCFARQENRGRRNGFRWEWDSHRECRWYPDYPDHCHISLFVDARVLTYPMVPFGSSTTAAIQHQLAKALSEWFVTHEPIDVPADVFLQPSS